MMFNKVLLTSMAVAGLALTAANTQFNKGKSTSDQAVKVTDSVNTKKVSTAVSSVDNLKSLENTAASQTVASSDDDSASASSSDDTSNSQSQVTSLSATTTQVAQATPVATSTAAQASSTSTAAASTSSASTATTSAAATTSTASGDINWLISRESGGNVNAQNGQFYGIGQLSPAAYATYVPGQNYQGNYAVQLQAMQAYIAARYGSVANAISHFQSNGWY